MKQATQDKFSSFDGEFHQANLKINLSDSNIEQKHIVFHRFNRRDKVKPLNHTNSSLNDSSRLNISLNNRNMTETSVKIRKFTLRELDNMQRDVFFLTNTKNDFKLPLRSQRKDEAPQTTYRRFQRCSFFDRDAIYFPKKQTSQEKINKIEKNKMKESSSINWDYQEQAPMFTVPEGDVDPYMETIVKTPKKKLSRFAIKLSQKIRSRFLKDIKEYNSSSMKEDIELSKINNNSLWLDQFGDLKEKLINVEQNQQTKYRKSICGRSYNPYMQFLAMTKEQKRMVRKTYCFDVVSPKRIIS